MVKKVSEQLLLGIERPPGLVKVRRVSEGVRMLAMELEENWPKKRKLVVKPRSRCLRIARWLESAWTSWQ